MDELFGERSVPHRLNKLGKIREALGPVETALREEPSAENRRHAALIHSKLGNDERALDLMQKGITEMSRKERQSNWDGAMLLVRMAAAANRGRHDQVRIGLEDFRAAAPGVDTIAKIRKWIDPRSGIAGHEPLFEALRKAGIPD